jgi:hypothetical protein
MSLGYVCCGSGSTASCIRAGETCDMPPVVDGGAVFDARTVSSPFVTIAIGHAHACSSRQDLSVDCIGDNSKGQATPPPGQFYAVVAGGDVTCGSKVDKSDVTKNGLSVCWGDNTYGQTSVPPGVTVAAIGARHACGNDRDGNVVCWGDNIFGQATPPGGVISFLTAGRNHTCGVRYGANDAGAPDGGIVCWGDNSFGQSTPPDFATIGGVSSNIVAGGDHTCVSDGHYQLWCWGDHSAGQSTPPVGAFTSLAIAPGHGCAIPHPSPMPDPITCWGDEWGNANPIPPPGEFNNIFAGEYATCAWANDGSGRPVICWGATYEPWY